MLMHAVFFWAVQAHIESASDVSVHVPIGPDHRVTGGFPGFRAGVDDSGRLFPQTAQGILRPVP